MALNRNLLICTLLLFLFGSSVSSAAVFTYYGGGLESQSEIHIENLTNDEVTWTDPDTARHPSSVASEQSMEVDSISSSTHTQGRGSYQIINPDRLIVSVSAEADGTASYDGSINAYSYTQTFEYGVTYGIFFEILPQPGESVGDDILVNFYWRGRAQSIGNGTYAGVNGSGYDEAVSILVNEYPTSRPSSDRAWQHASLNAYGEDFSYYPEEVLEDESGSFTAQIGDIIGITLEAYAEIADITGSPGDISAFASSSLSLSLGHTSAVPVPGAILLFGSGLLGIAGIKRRK